MRMLTNKDILILLSMIYSMSTIAQAAELIDRAHFFADSELSASRLSPDGQWVSFMKPYEGTRNLWIKRIDAEFDDAKLITAESPRPIGTYFWSRDSKYLLFVKDNDGDENFNVYVVDPHANVAENQIVPTSRNITSGKNVRARIYARPRSSPDKLIVGLNDRSRAWHDIYEVSIASGEKKLLIKNKNRLQRVILDHDDKLRIAQRAAKNGDIEFLLMDEKKPRKVYSCSALEICGIVGFNKDNSKVYVKTNKGDRDLAHLILLDLKSGQETFVEMDPDNRVDLDRVIISPNSRTLLATTYVDDKINILWHNGDFEGDYRWLKKQLPGKEIVLSSITLDEKMLKVTAFSSRDPGTVYIFDRENRKLSPQYQVRPGLPRDLMGEVRSIRYPSSDGLEIPAYLILPKGVEASNLPLVVNPHGGPWSRSYMGFSSTAQFLASRGYVVLQPNFRGSAGYGKAFLDAGNKQWGDLMQDDLTWGVKYLVKEGLVDAKRVAIMGASYGGYAALAGITFTPELYAAAVAVVAPSNLITLKKSVPAYWEAGRARSKLRMGDHKSRRGKKQLIRQSPLTHADKIVTPLLIAHGANDPRVKQKESDQIVKALRKRNYPVSYLLAPDEGHGFKRPLNRLALMTATEHFLACNLDGLAQKEVDEATAQRIEDITVDPDSI